MRAKWEYMIVEDHYDEDADPISLYHYGGLGWELVSVTHSRNYSSYYFKREKQCTSLSTEPSSEGSELTD